MGAQAGNGRVRRAAEVSAALLAIVAVFAASVVVVLGRSDAVLAQVCHLRYIASARRSCYSFWAASCWPTLPD